MDGANREGSTDREVFKNAYNSLPEAFHNCDLRECTLNGANVSSDTVEKVTRFEKGFPLEGTPQRSRAA